MMRLLIGTNNSGKLAEIQSLLADLPIKLVSPHDLGLSLDVIEDGSTYRENAAIKAKAFTDASRLPALADDTGLEVDALDGAPGLYSARFAPVENPTDADRRRYLLGRLHTHQQPWTARFRCVVAIATPGGDMYFSEGVCPGEIIPEERGDHGFGYDPIFQLQETGLTMAELSMEQKNILSHRAKAVLNARTVLLGMMEKGENQA